MDTTPTSDRIARRSGLWLAAGLILSLAGCDQKNEYVPPPPPEVTVSAPIARTITTYKEFTGNAQGFETVDLRARVKGFLQEIHFEPGADVEEGDLLFTIDPKPFKATVDSARADLANKQALLASTDAEYRRAAQLYERNVYAELDLIKARAARDAADAALDAARAALDAAELDLSYTQVFAPISGQISRNLVDVGNLVGDNEATLLATIVKYDPIRAYFTVSETDHFRFLEMHRRGERPDFREERIPMELGLINEEGYPHEGYLEYSDPTLDTKTGTILGRAIFPNSERVIVPGAFVRLRIPYEQNRQVLLVPERVLGSDLAGRYVLVVNDEGVVEHRNVQLGSQLEELIVIEKGLQGGEQVVVNGIQRARPGAKVKAIPAKVSGDDAAEAEATASTTTDDDNTMADALARADAEKIIEPPPPSPPH